MDNLPFSKSLPQICPTRVQKNASPVFSISIHTLCYFTRVPEKLMNIIIIFFAVLSETASCYSFAPTPPPGSPYSPLPVTHLELLTKNFNNNNIIIQQQEYNSTNNNHSAINNFNIISTKKDIDKIYSRNLVNNNNNLIDPTDPQKQPRWCPSSSSMVPLTVKTENFVTNIKQKSCACRNTILSPSGNRKFVIDTNGGGCSRTSPWTPCNFGCAGGNTPVHVKREPATPTTPACQVAEISSNFVKIEPPSPNSITPKSVNFENNSIVQTTMSSITTCSGKFPNIFF